MSTPNTENDVYKARQRNKMLRGAARKAAVKKASAIEGASVSLHGNVHVLDGERGAYVDVVLYITQEELLTVLAEDGADA